jgi:hypothetical protein
MLWMGLGSPSAVVGRAWQADAAGVGLRLPSGLSSIPAKSQSDLCPPYCHHSPHRHRRTVCNENPPNGRLKSETVATRK